MTWVKFLAGPEDLVEVMRFVYAETDCRVFEAYSIPDQQRRELAPLDSVAPLFESGGPHLVLWSPSVGAPPAVRRVPFAPGAVPGHTHRYVTEGCSLITLLGGFVELGHALSLAHGGVRLRDPSQPMAKLELRGAGT